MKKTICEAVKCNARRKGLTLLLLFALLAVGATGCKKTNESAAKDGGNTVQEEKQAEEDTPESIQENTEQEQEQEVDSVEEVETPAEEEEPGEKEASGYVSEEFMYTDENGNPLTEEDIANINGSGSVSTGTDGTGSTYTEYTDLAPFIMNASIGVEMLEGLPFTPSSEKYYLYDDGMYEICYKGDDGQEIDFRKAEGAGDISGVYEDFEKTTTKKIADVDVTLSFQNGKCSLATWADDTYAYSIHAKSGITEDEMTGMIKTLRSSAQ